MLLLVSEGDECFEESVKFYARNEIYIRKNWFDVASDGAFKKSWPNVCVDPDL